MPLLHQRQCALRLLPVGLVALGCAGDITGTNEGIDSQTTQPTGQVPKPPFVTSSSVGTASPSVGTASPSVGTASPGVGTASPSVGTASPGVGTASPGVGTASPGVGTASPGVGTASPAPVLSSQPLNPPTMIQIPPVPPVTDGVPPSPPGNSGSPVDDAGSTTDAGILGDGGADASTIPTPNPLEEAAYPEDLVIHWRFEEADGAVRYANAGTLGAVHDCGLFAREGDDAELVTRSAPGLLGAAAQFDGASVARCGDAPWGGAGARTVSVWVQRPQNTEQSTAILGWGIAKSHWDLEVNFPGSRFELLTGSGRSALSISPTELSSERWHHFVTVLASGDDTLKDVDLFANGTRFSGASESSI